MVKIIPALCGDERMRCAVLYSITNRLLITAPSVRMRIVYTPFAALFKEIVSLAFSICLDVTILPVISNTVTVAWLLLLLSEMVNVPLLGLG